MKTALLILIIATLAAACTKKIYVPVESTHSESRERIAASIATDTVRDIRLIYVNGDTVRDTRTLYRTRTTTRTDTVVIQRTDTVAVVQAAPHTVTKWQRLKTDLGGITLGACIAAMIFILVKTVLKFRRSFIHC